MISIYYTYMYKLHFCNISTYSTKPARNLSKRPMSNLHSSLLRCWVPLSLSLSLSLYRIISGLWYRVPLHPQSTTTHLKIYSHLREFDTPAPFSQFQGIFCRSRCLVVYCEWQGGVVMVVVVVGVAIFTLLKLALTRSPYLNSPNLSWQILVKNWASQYILYFNNEIEV